MKYFNQNVIGIHQPLMVLLLRFTANLVLFLSFHNWKKKCSKEFYSGWRSVQFTIWHEWQDTIVVGQRSVFGFSSFWSMFVCEWVSVSNRDRMNGIAIEHSSFSSSVFKINIRLECWLLGRCSSGSFITSVGGLGEDFYYIYILYIYTCIWVCVCGWMRTSQSKWFRSERENWTKSSRSDTKWKQCIYMWLVKRKEIHLTTGIE